METSNRKVRIALAAGQFINRLGIKTILSVLGVEPDLFETHTYTQLNATLKAESFDFIILHEDVLHDPKSAQINHLKTRCNEAKILVIGDAEIDNCACSTFVLSGDNQKVVLDKFQEFIFSPLKEESSADKFYLSERETEILKEVALGASNKEIADKLFISAHTVISHRKNITEKLGIKSIAGLTVFALMNNIIKPDEAMQ